MSRLSFPWRIYIIALVLRLIPVLLTRSLGIGLDDMFQYDMIARSLASGNGFRWYAVNDLRLLKPYVDFDLSTVEYDPVRGVPTSFRAPLYPAFLGMIYYVTGAGLGRFFAARLVQAGLSALLAPLTFLVSRRLFPGDESAAVTSAWIVASYPLLIIYPIGLATENLFFLFVLTSFFFLLRIPKSSLPTPDLQPLPPESRFPILTPLLSGFFLALAALTRSVILPFAGLAVLWVWFVLKQKNAAVFIVLTVVALIAPWVVRNSFLHHKLTGIESSMGYNLYVGYHPESNGSFTFGPSLDLLTILDDAERDELGTHKALGFIRAEPDRVLPLAFNRLGFFFGLEKRALMYFYSNNLLGYISGALLLVIAVSLLLPFVIISLSAVFGLALSRLNSGINLLYLLLAAYIIPHVIILSEDRFHLAIVPFLAILAAQSWTRGRDAFVSRWREAWTGKVVICLAVFAALLLILNWGFELSRDADKIAALFGPDGNKTYFPY